MSPASSSQPDHSAIENTVASLEPVLAELATVVGGLPADRRDDPTPCSEYTVAQLRDHVVGWLTAFAAGFADENGRAPDLSQTSTTQDPAGQVRAATRQLVGAVRAGAGHRALWLGESSLPGAMALQMILWEYQVHGWDLAIATGQSWSPAAEGLCASLDFAPGMLTPHFQGAGKAFDNPVAVAADAPPLDRLVALSGRNPCWRPRT